VIWLLQLIGVNTRLGLAAIVSLGVGGLALAAATFHLGRPAYAYRALKMWRRSWLSREVLAFAAFSHVAAIYAGLLWLQWPMSVWVGGLTVVLGLAGVTASACIYRVPARPAWNTRYTLLQFNLTAAILGPLFAAAAVAGANRWLAITAASMAAAQATVFALRFFRSVSSDRPELKGTARLLSTVLAPWLVLRGLLLATGAIALPLLATGLGDVPGRWLVAVALLVALAAEIIERYLFFVSVVPKHLAAPYLASASEAA
jgi:formate dehydrogenase iron-sulfur subunit